VWRSTVPLDRISRSGFAIGTNQISWRITNVVSIWYIAKFISLPLRSGQCIEILKFSVGTTGAGAMYLKHNGIDMKPLKSPCFKVFDLHFRP
jgi:hypothetical protein